MQALFQPKKLERFRVLLSHGLGVETAAICERWIADPSSRILVLPGGEQVRFELSDVTIITSQVGEEHDDTIALMEKYQLPRIRECGIRYVEVARRGLLEEDGITVLQDTRAITKMNPQGVSRLSAELLRAGTVPQFGSEHRCAMKYKGFVIETWMALEFQGCQDVPVYHVFGYNADEPSRKENSDLHIQRHNADREIPVNHKPPLLVFGFNSEEVGRVTRSRAYDGPLRTGCYPLVDWGWDRQKCLDYLQERYGVLWMKSACPFCPFNAEAGKATKLGIDRLRKQPNQAAHGLLVEHMSLSMNPRGTLYRDRTLLSVLDRTLTQDIMGVFRRQLAAMPWALYRVRRIYSKKGKAARCVQRLETGTQQEMLKRLNNLAFDKANAGLRMDHGIAYVYFDHRKADVYPSVEGFYVAAPALVVDKCRAAIDVFDQRYQAARAGTD